MSAKSYRYVIGSTEGSGALRNVDVSPGQPVALGPNEYIHFGPVAQQEASEVTKDSGKREEFPSGYQRDCREGKGRFDLLPYEGIKALALLFERGAAKYGESNWKKGAPLSRYCDSMLRHAFQAANGQEDEQHFISVAWNALCAYTTREMARRGELPKELDDLRHE